jgi:hypothetical protein
MSRSHDSDWVGYGRSFLLTLGLLFIAIPCWVWHKQGDRASEWPTFSWILFWGVGVLGVILLLVGLLASARAVEWWADAASRHEASIIVMVIAAPVHFLLRWVTRKR